MKRTSDREFGRLAFQAYFDAVIGLIVSASGKRWKITMPTWKDVPAGMKRGWVQAAREVRARQIGELMLALKRKNKTKKARKR